MLALIIKEKPGGSWTLITYHAGTRAAALESARQVQEQEHFVLGNRKARVRVVTAEEWERGIRREPTGKNTKPPVTPPPKPPTLMELAEEEFDEVGVQGREEVPGDQAGSPTLGDETDSPECADGVDEESESGGHINLLRLLDDLR